MTTFKALLAIQSTEIDLLQRLIRNFGKDGPARKDLDYLKEKQLLFAEKFQRISINNTTLERTKKTDCDQDYFKKDVFDDIKLLYMSVEDQIKLKIGEIEQSPMDSPINSCGSLEDTMFPSPEKTTSDNESEATTSAQEKQGDSNPAEKTTNNDFEKHLEEQLDLSINFMPTNNDMISLQYDEIMDMLANVEDINNNTSIGIVSAHLDNLKSTWNEFRKTMYQARVDGKEINFSYNSLLQTYMSKIGKLNEILNTPKSIVKENTSSSIQFASPKIELPTFSGKPSEWRGFISLFDRMVHNTKMENGMKIEYLKTRVKGDAAKIINHLEPTSENHNTCYALIRKRYDNKRESLGIWIDNILNLQPIRKRIRIF